MNIVAELKSNYLRHTMIQVACSRRIKIFATRLAVSRSNEKYQSSNTNFLLSGNFLFLTFTVHKIRKEEAKDWSFFIQSINKNYKFLFFLNLCSVLK